MEQSRDNSTQCVLQSLDDVCPTGTYYNSNSAPCPLQVGPSVNQTCCSCPKTCTTCTGPLMSDCIECAGLTSWFNNTCVPTNSTNGVCNGNMIVNNGKRKMCDSKNLPHLSVRGSLTFIDLLLACPAKCTKCEIPDFDPVTSTINQLQCTDCLPGSFLSNGTCIESCPVGTFPSPRDNVTCTGSLRFVIFAFDID